MYTRYFCVPFEDLAARTACYQDIYHAFAAFWPARGNRSVLRSFMGETSQGNRAVSPILAAGVQRLLAMRVAALLLTGQRVCILGADGTDVGERLAFLDGVMSLLPYGMRSRLSGATCASSTAYDHQLRLFFSGARRDGGDHVVFWDQAEHQPIGHRYADDYLRWLAEGVQQPETLLATVTEPMGFGPRDVAMMLERLDVSYSEPTFSAVAPTFQAPSPAMPEQVTSVDPDTYVAGILRECGRRLTGGNPDFLDQELTKLRTCLAVPPPHLDRTFLQQVITEQGLLSPHPSVRKHRQ